MLAGDASYLESTMLSGTVDGVSPDETVAAATLARIREFCSQRPTVYLPAHDPHAAQRLRQSRTVGARVTARESELLAGGDSFAQRVSRCSAWIAGSSPAMTRERRDSSPAKLALISIAA
jgi:hypothetical protein